MRLKSLLWIACFLSGNVMATAVDPFRDFADLTGHWTCHGVFPASGKTIDSTIRFDVDLNGKALIKHHDDTSPSATYHALEAWGYDAKNGRYNAAILDSFGGARLFSSDGWKDGRLVWHSAPEIKPAQRFTYIREPKKGLRIDWEVEREGNFVVGDTLQCSLEGTGQ